MYGGLRPIQIYKVFHPPKYMKMVAQLECKVLCRMLAILLIMDIIPMEVLMA